MLSSKRLDQVLVEKFIFDSRNKAQTAIVSGSIKVNGQIITKCSYLVNSDDEIAVAEKLPKYVGRGGEKLEAAIKKFNIDVKDKVAIDIGASTGGFSECLINNGVKLIFAIDVGQNQLSPLLRDELKLISLEKVNARYLTLKRLKNILEERKHSDNIINLADVINFAVVDVSFISILKIMPSLLNLLNSGSEILALIKPQFEASKGKVKNKGVIKDKEIIKRIVGNVRNSLAEQGLEILDTMPSVILGASGNQEYFFYMKKMSV